MKRKKDIKNRKPVGNNRASCFFFVGICLFVLEEPMLLVQVISGDFQCFAEPLEVHHFPFPQEAQGSKNVRVFRKVDEVFIGAAGFLLCCTFGSVIWEVL